MKTSLKLLKTAKKCLLPTWHKCQGIYPPGHFLAENYGFLLILFLFVSFILSGCGFHLKGINQAGQASYQSVKLVDAHLANVAVQRSLRQQFDSMGVRVVSSLADSDLEVVFSATQFIKSTTARTGQGDVSEQLLKMSQAFVVKRVETDEVVLRATVESFRDHSVISGLLQASSRELQKIKRQMATDIALKMVTRINYSTTKKTPQ